MDTFSCGVILEFSKDSIILGMSFLKIPGNELLYLFQFYVLLIPAAPSSMVPAALHQGPLHFHMGILDKISDSSSFPCLPQGPTFTPQEVVIYPLTQQTLGIQAIFNISVLRADRILKF